MSDNKERGFARTAIARAAAAAFRTAVQPVAVDMKYRREVGDFVRTIERAHEEAANSQTCFRNG